MSKKEKEELLKKLDRKIKKYRTKDKKMQLYLCGLSYGLNATTSDSNFENMKKWVKTF